MNKDRSPKSQDLFYLLLALYNLGPGIKIPPYSACLPFSGLLWGSKEYKDVTLSPAILQDPFLCTRTTSPPWNLLYKYFTQSKDICSVQGRALLTSIRGMDLQFGNLTRRRPGIEEGEPSVLKRSSPKQADELLSPHSASVPVQGPRVQPLLLPTSD